jgi:hypothetical protein
MNIFVDIDNTICLTRGSDYENSEPIFENIAKINKLFNDGNKIVYYSARGGRSGVDWSEFTKKQLDLWRCSYNDLIMNHKLDYDLFICDKTKRIEEI